MGRMTPDTIDFNSLSKKQLVELVITKYNDYFRLEEENRKLKDSNTILMKGGQAVFTLEKRIDELLEENKKLKHENSYRAGIVDILPKGKGHTAEETIQDLQARINELKEEVEQLKNQRIFNSTEYDLITLTSTTPQWELRRK